MGRMFCGDSALDAFGLLCLLRYSLGERFCGLEAAFTGILFGSCMFLLAGTCSSLARLLVVVKE